MLVSSLLESCPGYAAGLAPAVEVKRRGAQVGLVFNGALDEAFCSTLSLAITLNGNIS